MCQQRNGPLEEGTTDCWVLDVHQDGVVKLAVDQEGAGEGIDLGDVNHPLEEIEGVFVTQPDFSKVALNVGFHDSGLHGSEEILCFRVKGGTDKSRLERVKTRTCKEEAEAAEADIAEVGCRGAGRGSVLVGKWVANGVSGYLTGDIGER